MSLGIATVGSICTGHDNFPPRLAITGSDSVFINGKAVHCVYDLWETHCNHGKNRSCHDAFLLSGSETIFVGGKAVGRVGDLLSCGSFIASGSEDVGI